jgi:predicted nucleic acid-binding protein
VPRRLVYLDSSAYAKLVLEQSGHVELRRELAEWPGYVSSALLAVEAVRACARYGVAYANEARAWLEGIALLPIDDPVLDEATSLEPPALRSLDALHLATALSIRDDLGAFIAYDERLSSAAAERGLKVVTP